MVGGRSWEAFYENSTRVSIIPVNREASKSNEYPWTRLTIDFLWKIIVFQWFFILFMSPGPPVNLTRGGAGGSLQMGSHFGVARRGSLIILTRTSCKLAGNEVRKSHHPGHIPTNKKRTSSETSSTSIPILLQRKQTAIPTAQN